MNPILYESRETDFNHNGLGKMNETLSAIVTEVANGEFELEVVYPIGGRLYKHIQDHMLIKAKPNSADDPHVFRIYEHTIDTVEQTVTIYAHTKSNDLGQNLVKDVVINSLTPQEAMNRMKMNLVEPTDYSFVSDITTRSSTKWENRNPLNCIAGEEGSLIHYWGGEIKRDNRTIYLYRRRGRDNVAIIRDGKNIDGVSLEYSTKGMVTKIIPYRTYTPENSDNEVVEYGTPVESQYIGNYPLVYVRAIDYSNDDDVTSLQTMNTKANRYFTENNGIDKPSVNVNVNLVELSDSSEYEKFKDFENVELFDSVTVYSKQYDINIEAKITTVVYDSLTGKNVSLEMGSYRTGLIESTERSYIELIGEKEAKLVQTIQVAANGKNRVFRGVDEPTTGMVKNDLWYKPVGDGETEMYQFDGAYWQLILSTADTTKVQREVEAAQAAADSAKQEAITGRQEAIEEAERLVVEQDFVYQEIFDAYDGAVESLTNSVAEADSKATDALEQAGISAGVAQTAKEAAERAESSASGAQTKAQEAFTKADDAIAKVDGIPSTISDIIADKGLVSGDWVDTRIDDVTGEINYELTSVRGEIPDVIMGVEWDTTSNPDMLRTDYVQSLVDLSEYELKTAEYDLSIEGFELDITQINQNKLDTGVFTMFKNNEYANDVSGIRQRITDVEDNKLDDVTFQNFKEHEYDVSVAGITGSITDLENHKLDSEDFDSFRTNEYQLTVDGFEMNLMQLSGAIPNYVMGVEWYLAENPNMTRTDFLEETDLSNYNNPDYIMGIEWSKVSDPALLRTDGTEELTSRADFEVFLGDYNFAAEGWNATNTYVDNNKTQINNLISNASGWQQTITYVDNNQTKFNETIAQVDSYKQTIGSNGEKIAQLVMTDDAFITKVEDLEGQMIDFVVGVEWERTAEPTMARTGYMDDYLSSQVAQLAGSWALTLKSGNDIKTQINATTDGLRFDADLIHLGGTSQIDNAVIKSAHIDTLNVSKLVGTTAEFTTLRGKVISANSITSDMLSVNTALIDKLFATEALIERLTSKEAFIASVKAVDISADQIKAGTLNAANVNIINLNVSQLTGDVANFVQSAWNGINANLTINSSGLTSNSSNGTQYRLGATGVEYIADGATRGVIKAYNSGDGPYAGAARGVAAYAYRGNEFHIGYQGNPTSGTYLPAITVHGTTGDISLLSDNVSILSDNITLDVPTIYPNKSSNDNFTINYMNSGGVSIRNGSDSGAGLYLHNSGAVQVVGTGNFIPGVMSSEVSRADGLKISRTTISGTGGYKFSHSNANDAGIIFADNGYIYIKTTSGNYSVVNPNFGN